MGFQKSISDRERFFLGLIICSTFLNFEKIYIKM